MSPTNDVSDYIFFFTHKSNDTYSALRAWGCILFGNQSWRAYFALEIITAEGWRPLLKCQSSYGGLLFLLKLFGNLLSVLTSKVGSDPNPSLYKQKLERYRNLAEMAVGNKCCPFCRRWLDGWTTCVERNRIRWGSPTHPRVNNNWSGTLPLSFSTIRPYFLLFLLSSFRPNAEAFWIV